MTEDQLHQIDQARRYAEQDEYVVTRTHIRNLLAIIDESAEFEDRNPTYAEMREEIMREEWRQEMRRDAFGED